MISSTADGYAGVIAERMAAASVSLSAAWLVRLNETVSIDPKDAFPSDQILDHVPLLIREIARYVGAPSEEAIAANTAVIDKSRELGRLRHQQRVSVHQLLHEYEILNEVLEGFVVDETSRLGLAPASDECFTVLRRLTRAVRVLMRTTVDTFVAEYTATIEERNARLEAFHRMASHELRSPLGTILFAAAVLEQDQTRRDSERVLRVAKAVRANADRMARLVDNLQRVARLAGPAAAPFEQEIDLGALTRDVVQQLEEMAQAHGVVLRLAADLPTVFGDPARIELVLLNLISNAIKYSDPQKADRFIEVRPADPAGPPVAGLCTICVRDNGLGIPEAAQPAIFERFFRAHAARDSELGVTGTGLGLAIVADCIKELRGAIRFESTPGEGTAFYVTLGCETTQA